MPDKRKNERVECFNNCQLTYNGKTYKGILENLSNSGALIKFVRKQRSAIPDGSLCTLMIGNDSFLIPGEFTGRVIYNNLYKIGLQFQF